MVVASLVRVLLPEGWLPRCRPVHPTNLTMSYKRMPCRTLPQEARWPACLVLSPGSDPSCKVASLSCSLATLRCCHQDVPLWGRYAVSCCKTGFVVALCLSGRALRCCQRHNTCAPCNHSGRRCLQAWRRRTRPWACWCRRSCPRTRRSCCTLARPWAATASCSPRSRWAWARRWRPARAARPGAWLWTRPPVRGAALKTGMLGCGRPACAPCPSRHGCVYLVVDARLALAPGCGQGLWYGELCRLLCMQTIWCSELIRACLELHV